MNWSGKLPVAGNTGAFYIPTMILAESEYGLLLDTVQVYTPPAECVCTVQSLGHLTQSQFLQ